MKPLVALRRYMAAADPRVATANLVAMVLAWNTPFYPLYLVGTAGTSMQPGAWFTLVIFPVFLVVPAITRQRPMAGRILLATAGLANTIWCTWLLGEASATQLFLLPCIFLAAILFRQGERLPLLLFLTLPTFLGLALHGRYPASPFACAAVACENLIWLNAFSVACLCSFLGLATVRLCDAITRENAPTNAPAPTRLPPPQAR